MTVTAGLVAILTAGVLEGTAAATARVSTQGATAKKALLVLSDLPQGWTSHKSPGGANPLAFS